MDPGLVDAAERRIRHEPNFPAERVQVAIERLLVIGPFP
jgi:hypothetical protein